MDPNDREPIPEGSIRLRSGIDINQLRGQDGVIFEPEIDESFFENNAEDTTYFANVDESQFNDLMEKVAQDRDNHDNESDDENLTEFENKLRKMTPVQFEQVSENGDKKMVTVEGVQKRVIQKGLSSRGQVPAKSTVTVDYSLFLEGQDEPFDSTRLRNRREKYLLDDGRLLPGMEFAIKSMMVQEKSEFIIQPEYGYGKMGCGPRIPGDSQILAVIELTQVVQEAEAESLMSLAPEERNKKKTFDDIYKAAKIENFEGSNYVREKEFNNASKRYDQGIRLLEDVELRNDEDENNQKSLLKKLYLNHGRVCLELKKPKRVCTDMRKVLEIDNKNAKAMYRMAKAKILLGHYDEALHYFNRAQRICPNDPDIQSEKIRLERQIARERQNEKELCKKMFQSNLTSDSNPEPEASVPENVDDEDFSDIYAQLKAFQESDDSEPLKLPSSFNPGEIALARRIARDLGLNIKERKRNDFTQWMVVKE